MKIVRAALVCLLAGGVLAGCQALNIATRSDVESFYDRSRVENQRLMNHVNTELMNIYKETADAQYLLFFEYDQLARDLAEQGKDEDAQKARRLAELYRAQQKDYEALAARRRSALSATGAAASPAPAATSPALP